MPKGSPRKHLPQLQPFEDTEKAMQIARVMFSPDKTENSVDLKDAEQVEQAIQIYIDKCISDNLRPGIVGLCAAIGLTYREFKNELNGLSHKTSPECLSIIKKYRSLINAYMEQCASQGVLNPVLAIFWQKNYVGLTDTQAVELIPKTDMAATQTLEQIEESIPLDITEEQPEKQ